MYVKASRWMQLCKIIRLRIDQYLYTPNIIVFTKFIAKNGLHKMKQCYGCKS